LTGRAARSCRATETRVAAGAADSACADIAACTTRAATHVVALHLGLAGALRERTADVTANQAAVALVVLETGGSDLTGAGRQ
jgi:hypothetical protein